jgi:dTDP-4-dehydrorhamnose reductase
MRLLVTGASGQLGAYLLRDLAGRDHEVTAWSGSRHSDLFGVPLTRVDLTNRDSVVAAFRAARPATVIHCAALTDTAKCHSHPEQAEALNVRGTRLLAELADETRARLVHVSTDLVFNGERSWYVEEDAPAPVSVYGWTKVRAEEAVRACGRGVVVRVSWMFGPTLTGQPKFFDDQVSRLRASKRLPLYTDQWRTPLSLTTAALALIALAETECTGTLHLGGPERMSRFEFGRRLAEFLGADASVIDEKKREDMPGPEPRPRDTSLDSSRWRGLFPRLSWPTWEQALAEMGGENLLHG